MRKVDGEMTTAHEFKRAKVRGFFASMRSRRATSLKLKTAKVAKQAKCAFRFRSEDSCPPTFSFLANVAVLAVQIQELRFAWIPPGKTCIVISSAAKLMALVHRFDAPILSAANHL